MININGMYRYAKENNEKLLGSYAGTWWADYLSNSEQYDAVFNRLYYSFYYFMQSSVETVDDVLAHWQEDVENLLLLHDKEFSELWRVKVLAADAYNLVNNYDMTETLQKTTGESLGSRSDSYTNTVGAQNNSTTNKVAPFDTEQFKNEGQMETSLGNRSDSGSATTGAQQNSGSENYTLKRSGNIGTMTSTDVMQKHVNFWTAFDFYHYVFGVIARELITVNAGGDDYAD